MAKKFVNTSIKKGSREVVISNQNTAGVFESRLYINRGQTATLTHATHKTLAGALKWANKILAR